MAMNDRSDAMKKGLCFKCGKPGHRARDPQFHLEQVRSLLVQMEEEDKEEFFKDAEKEGF